MDSIKTNIDLKFKWLHLSVSLFFIFIYWYANISIFFIIGALFLIILFIKESHITGFSMLFLLLPVENMTRMEGAPFSIVTLIIVILFLKLLFDKRFKVDFFMLIISITIFCMLLFSTLFFGRLFELDNLRFLINIIFISSLIIMYREKIIEYSFHITKYFILGALLLLLFSIVYSLQILNIDFLSTRLYGLQEDPNYIAIVFSVAISLCIINLYNKKFNPIIGGILIIVFLFGMFLTQSRGGFISLVPNLVFIFFLFFKTDRKQILPYFSFFVLVSILINFNRDLLIFLIDNLSSRINRIESDGGSYRLDIWYAYLDLYSNDLSQLLLGPKSEVIIGGNIPITVAHNLIIGTITKSGGINLFLITSSLVYIAVVINRLASYKAKIIGYLPLFTMLLGYFFLDAIFINIFIYVFVLSILMSKSA